MIGCFLTFFIAQLISPSSQVDSYSLNLPVLGFSAVSVLVFFLLISYLYRSTKQTGTDFGKLGRYFYLLPIIIGPFFGVLHQDFSAFLFVLLGLLPLLFFFNGRTSRRSSLTTIGLVLMLIAWAFLYNSSTSSDPYWEFSYLLFLPIVLLSELLFLIAFLINLFRKPVPSLQ